MDDNDFLDMPWIKTVKVNSTESERDYYVTAEYEEPIRCCHSCGVIRNNSNINKFGRRWFTYMDAPIRGRRVVIAINRQRYKCHDCGSTFFVKIPQMDDKRAATIRLVQHIQERSLHEPHTKIAEDTGLNEKTIRNIFREHIAALEKSFKFVAPRWMGIDEVVIMGKPRCILTNLEHKTVVDMLPDRDLETLRKYFMYTKGKRNIQYVAMDMWPGYVTICNEVVPDAKIVIDKFHVVRYASYALEQVRRSLRESLTERERKRLLRSRFVLLRRSELSEKHRNTLNEYLETFPNLYNAYVLKEFFYEIYESLTREEAAQRFSQWKATITPDVSYAFKKVADMVDNWYPHIFNYFEHPITNAYTESLNSVIRHIDRKGRGYSFEALRAKVLFTRMHHKLVTPAVKKAEFRDRSFSHSLLDTPVIWEPTETYGVPISTLEQVLKEEASYIKST